MISSVGGKIIRFEKRICVGGRGFEVVCDGGRVGEVEIALRTVQFRKSFFRYQLQHKYKDN